MKVKIMDFIRVKIIYSSQLIYKGVIIKQIQILDY